MIESYEIRNVKIRLCFRCRSEEKIAEDMVIWSQAKQTEYLVIMHETLVQLDLACVASRFSTPELYTSNYHYGEQSLTQLYSSFALFQAVNVSADSHAHPSLTTSSYDAYRVVVR